MAGARKVAAISVADVTLDVDHRPAARRDRCLAHSGRPIEIQPVRRSMTMIDLASRCCLIEKI